MDVGKNMAAKMNLDAGKILYSEEGTDTPVGTLYDDDFLNLANVIILQAMDDYAFGYKQMLLVYKEKRFFPTKEEFETAHKFKCNEKAIRNFYHNDLNSKMCLYYETQDFFISEWGKFLMRNIKVPTKDLMKKVEEDVEARFKDDKKFHAHGLNSYKSLV